MYNVPDPLPPYFAVFGEDIYLAPCFDSEWATKPHLNHSSDGRFWFHSCNAHAILHWLAIDCIYDYVFYSGLTFFMTGRISCLIFQDKQGAVEFKLRFG